MRYRFAAIALLFAMPVYAHGPAEWIQQGQYKNSVGELCCGVIDCGYMTGGTIVHVTGGYEVDADFTIVYGGATRIMHIKEFIPESEATPSPTGEYWACAWGGSRKCFFSPLPGS